MSKPSTFKSAGTIAKAAVNKGRSIAGNLKETLKLVKRAASFDEVVTGGAR